MQILSGYKVLDLGSFITAPHAAMMLGELGADVIKVERPGTGDPFRWYNEGLSSPIFQTHNRNKRSLTLDLTRPEGRGVLDKLVAQADALVINVRPGVAERLGVDAARLQALNPRLVYCSVTGFGADGPYAARPAYDTVGLAASGLLSRTHQGPDARLAGPALSDTVTGMTACMGMLAALLERAKTGRGRLVETSMLEATLNCAIDPIIYYLVTGQEQPYYQRGAASQAYVVACRDGLRLCLHMSSPDKFWFALADAIDRPDLKTRYPDRTSRFDHYQDIAELLTQVFLAKDRDDWMALLTRHDVPFAPEMTAGTMRSDPQIAHLKVFNESRHEGIGTVAGVNRAVRFDGDNQSGFRGTPRLGEHTDEVLTSLGLSDADITALKAQGVC